MKRVHYLLLGLGLSLCIAAVGPGGGTIIPGGASNVALKNGTNVFTGTNTFSELIVNGATFTVSSAGNVTANTLNAVVYVSGDYVWAEGNASGLYWGSVQDTYLLRTAAGSVSLNAGAGSLTLRTISLPSGANSRAGNTALVAGTVTVAVNTVTTNTIVMITRKTSGGTPGMVITYTLNAGVGFTITSDNALDTSTLSYFLVENP